MKLMQMLLMILGILSATSCGTNPLAELASKSSAEAMYEAIKIDIDDENYDSAYTKSLELEAAYPNFTATDTYKRTKVGLLGGQCGFTFLTFVNGIGSAPGTTLFAKLAATFDGITVNPDKCIDAVAVLKTLSAPNGGDALYSMILNLANIGVILQASSVAPGLDVCGVGTIDANEISSTRMKNLVASFGTLLTSTADLGDAISGGLASLDDLDAVCNPGPGATPEELAIATALATICTSDDPAAVNAQTAATFRRMLADSSFGVGSCDMGDDLQNSHLGGAYSCCNNLIPDYPGVPARLGGNAGTEVDDP